MQKIVKLNRALLYCCMVVMFCLHSTGYAAPTQGKPVSITIKNSSLAEVLRQVSKKSGLYIYFQDADLAAHKNVTIDVRNKPVENVLHELLDGRGLSWVEVSENTIAVKKNEDLDGRKGEIGEDTVATITVTGKVVDEKGEPVIGATVLVKGGKTGTTTNAVGGFIINNVRSNAKLVISNLAYITQEITINGNNNLGSIRMVGYVNELDENIVVAYGKTTKRFNTGNVGSIKAVEIEKQVVNNPLYALQGRIPGLQIIPTGGIPGKSVSIQLRGKNTLRDALNGNADPLIVINGLPIVNNITGLGSNALLDFSALNFVNPNDIESIDVLKDADATSIYGSRGANGVILITTKKGEVGTTKLNVNLQTGWATVEKKVKLLKTPEYLTLRKEAFANDGIDFINTFPYGDPELKYILAPDLFIWGQNDYTDWQKLLIGGTAKYNDLQGSLSGGVTNIQYIIGGNYHRETTVFPGDNSDQKASVHLSINGQSSNQKLRTLVSASYMNDRSDLPGIDFTKSATTLAPNAPSIYKPDGTLNWAISPSGARSWENPYSELSKTYNARVNNLLASSEVAYAMFPFLVIKAQIGYNEMRGNSFRRTFPFKGRGPEEINIPAQSAFNSNMVRNVSFEPQISYNTHVGKGAIDVLLGGAIQSTTNENQTINAFGFTSDALLENLGSATTIRGSNNVFEYKYAAVFGRIGFNWKDTYLFNLTARRDGSSRFGPGNQFGNFGSFGAAWIFTEEKFLKNKFSILSFGKLRASYGTSGNDGIGDYQYLERYQPIQGIDPYQGARGYRSTGLFNAYYAWERTKKMEIGLESGFLNNRMLFNISYFRNQSDNQLLNFSFPSMAGPGNPKFNLPATIRNTGVEVSLQMENIKNAKFSWSTSINYTSNRNELVSFPDLANSPYYSQYEVGQPFFGNIRSYNFAGVDPVTGRYQFKDIKGTNTLTPEDPSRLDGGRYLRVMGIPKFFGGMSNTLKYKDIELDIFFQFTKQKGGNPLSEYYYLAGISPSNLPVDFLSRWQKEGDITSIQKLSGTYVDDLQLANDRILLSTVNYTDASFIRLKNLSLSYTMPGKWKEKVHVKNVRVYLQGQNLVTFTKYKGLDPETQSLGILPPLRVITVGMNLIL